MDEYKLRIIQVKESILEDNDADADKLREELSAEKTFYINVMSSPGSGKTSSILQLIARLRDEFRIGVLEADIDGDCDTRTMLKDLVILSVPEGDDKPLKYPLMFEKADVVLVNKIDALEVFDFDMDRFTEYVRMRNPEADIIPVSAETGEGFDAAADWIRAAVREWLDR